MPIPPTRYIDAGPGVPLANPQTAMATGDAMSRFGETIQHVGAIGFQVAEKVRKIEEAGKMSAFFSNMDEEASQFSNDLMTRSDTSAWPTEWKQKTGDMRERLKGLGLSPEGMATADREFGDWSTQRTIHFETQAASKAVQLGRAQVLQSADYYFSRGDTEKGQAELMRGASAGIINPVELEQGKRKGEEIATENMLTADIEQDPAGVLKQLEKPDEFMAANPGATTLMVERAKRMAQERVKDQQFDTMGAIQDDIVSGKIASLDELRQRGANLRPMAVAKLEGMMKEMATDEYKAKISTPEYQQSVVGKVSSLLSDYNPTADDFDEKFVEMDGLTRTLPPGAIRDELTRRIDGVRSGKLDEIKTHADAAMKALDVAHKAGRFMASPSMKGEVMPTQRAINDGFLRDPAKLQALGFTEKQTETIIGDKKTKDSQRENAFKTLWTKREGKDVSTGLIKDTAAAILNGETKVYDTDPESEDARISAKMQAERAYGAAKIKFADWLKTHPTAKDTEIDDKIFELGGEETRKALKSGAFDSKPQRGGPKGADNSTSAIPRGSNLVSVVKDFEAGGAPGGFFKEAYWDYGQWSIGYGTRSKKGEVIDKAEADKRLASELAMHRKRVVDHAAAVGLKLNTHEIDALTSFDYNTGRLEQLTAGGKRSKAEIADKMLLYRNAGGERLLGLERRRAAERALFLKGYA